MLHDSHTTSDEATPLSRLEIMMTTPIGAAIIIIAVSWLIYFPCLNNYFTWDDFIWLMKVKSLPRDPAQMFRIEKVYGGTAYYFDPLVYLSFWFDHLVGGLNYRWYHVVDILLHCGNGILVFLVARALCRELTAALLAALLFVSSFAIVDTVVWSSSRVDLFATLFSLISLLTFIRFLYGGQTGVPIMSAAWFALALCCKATPIILPLPLLILALREKRSLRDCCRCLLGHVLVASVYLVLLLTVISTLPRETADTVIHINVANILVALQSMVIPEARLAQMNPFFATIATVSVLVVLLLAPPAGPTRQLSLFGIVLLSTAILPLLLLKDFKLVTDISNAGHLLTSPSHRIYLAYTGMAFMLGGGVVGLLQRLNTARTGRTVIATAIILPILIASGVEARAREQLWDESAQFTRSFVDGFKPFRSTLQSNALLILINPPISRGFTTAALNVLYGIEAPLLYPMVQIPREIIDSPEIFQHRHDASLYVFTGKRMHSFSSELRLLIDISFRHLISNDPGEKNMLRDSYTIRADLLNTSIQNQVNNDRSALAEL